MLTGNPGIMQFTKDTEWLNDLLAYLPRFEDPGVLGTFLIIVYTPSYT